MKKIGFIGAYDKTDLIIYIAKILTVLNQKVLVIDATINQKARYVVPVINPTTEYVTEYEDIDIAVGFQNVEGIKRYIGLSEEQELEYDIILIDTDNYIGFEGFKLNEAIKICDEYKVLDNYATCNFLLADINFKKGKYSESVMGYEKALYYFIKNNDKDKLYKCYLNIGKIYMIEEFYKGAILQFEFSEGILNEIQVEDVDIYKDLYSKMAYCYIKLDNNEKSLDYINKMDEIDIKNNPEEELDVLILKANNFLNVGEFEKSKEYFKKALEILDKEKNKTELASIYLTISEIYKSVGKLDRSLEYSQRVYDIKKSDEDEYMMKSLFRIIETYISNYEYDMAKKYCKIALASSIKNKNRLNEYRVLKYYSDMHKAQNENIIAIEYLHKCINIISELNDEKILADLYINLGELYSDISKEKELEYYQKGVCIYKNLEII